MSLTKTLKRRNKKKRKVILWLLGIIIVTVIGGYIFWQQQDATKVTAQKGDPETITVSPNSYNVTVSGPGTLKPIRNLDTVAKVQGTIIRISQVGDQVSKGDILVQIDPVPFERAVTNAELALEKAKAQRAGLASSQANNSNSIEENIANAQISLQDANRQVEAARADLELTHRLFEIGSESAENVKKAQDTLDKALENQTSSNLNIGTLLQSQTFTNSSNSQDLKEADLAVEQAKLDLETARDDLDNTQIIAPFDGVVASVIGQVGGNSEGASSENQEGVTGGLLGLIDDSKLVLEAQVDETAIIKVQLDQKVEVTVDALTDRVFNGKVTAIADALTKFSQN